MNAIARFAAEKKLGIEVNNECVCHDFLESE